MEGDSQVPFGEAKKGARFIVCPKASRNIIKWAIKSPPCAILMMCRKIIFACDLATLEKNINVGTFCDCSLLLVAWDAHKHNQY